MGEKKRVLWEECGLTGIGIGRVEEKIDGGLVIMKKNAKNFKIKELKLSYELGERGELNMIFIL